MTATAAPFSLATKIVQTPGFMGGQPHIEGRRIRVKDIVNWFEHHGMGADEIADSYGLELTDIFSALAFYHAHRTSLRAQWERQKAFSEALKTKMPSKITQKRLHAQS